MSHISSYCSSWQLRLPSHPQANLRASGTSPLAYKGDFTCRLPPIPQPVDPRSVLSCHIFSIALSVNKEILNACLTLVLYHFFFTETRK